MGNILLSTAYFPPVSWMKVALKAEKVLIEAHETYPKQTYRNRCRIAAANGVLPLSIPVNKVNGKETRTKDIEISYSEDWQRIHRRSIQDAYTNSPFYLYFWDEFEVFYTKKYRFLIELNQEILQSVCKILEVQITAELSETFVHEPEGLDDLRYSIAPKLPVERMAFPRYQQVFEEKYGFQPDLSIMDLIFNQGPATVEYLGVGL
jgi:hypothetical protein